MKKRPVRSGGSSRNSSLSSPPPLVIRDLDCKVLTNGGLLDRAIKEVIRNGDAVILLTKISGGNFVQRTSRPVGAVEMSKLQEIMLSHEMPDGFYLILSEHTEGCGTRRGGDCDCEISASILVHYCEWTDKGGWNT